MAHHYGVGDDIGGAFFCDDDEEAKMAENKDGSSDGYIVGSSARRVPTSSVSRNISGDICEHTPGGCGQANGDCVCRPGETPGIDPDRK